MENLQVKQGITKDMSSKQILEYEGLSSVNIWKKTFQVEGIIKASILRQGTARRPVENETLK